MPAVGANLVFALLLAVSPPGDHEDRPYRGLMQLKAALASQAPGTVVVLLKSRHADSPH